MTAKRITPDCHLETATAGDLIDGLHTVSAKYGRGAILPPPGTGPDTPLGWAIQEVTAAAKTSDEAEVERLCTNAVMNGRRALACLVDWYIDRDLAKFCKNPPTTAKQKAHFLMSRGIVDELTSHVLERAVETRNRVEHDYVVPDLAKAEDIVELLRRSIAALRAHSDPSFSPLIFGIFLGSCGYGKQGPYAEFHGWSDPLVIFCRFTDRPWVGLLIPERGSPSRALLRQAFLDQTDTADLIDLLSLAERKYGEPSSFSDLASCEILMREIGVIQG